MHQRIKQYMVRYGLAVEHVAMNAGLSEETLRAILCGEQTLYADELRAICLALNVSPEAFVEE